MLPQQGTAVGATPEPPADPRKGLAFIAPQIPEGTLPPGPRPYSDQLYELMAEPQGYQTGRGTVVRGPQSKAGPWATSATFTPSSLESRLDRRSWLEGRQAEEQQKELGLAQRQQALAGASLDPVAKEQVERRKGLAEAATEEAKPRLMGAQGASFEGDAALRRAQAADLANPLRGTAIETENFIRAHPEYKDRLLPFAREFMLQSLIEQKRIPPGSTMIPPALLTPELKALGMSRAITKYLADTDRTYQANLARNPNVGFMNQPY